MSLTIKKIDTRYTSDGEGSQSEVFTYDVIGTGNWIPASEGVNADGVPRTGDEHPSKNGLFVTDISASHYRGQPDHIRISVTYSSSDDADEPSREGGGGSGDSQNFTPLDEPFLIEFTPNISRVLLKDDLDGKPVMNPNAEPYEEYGSRVRLDGVCRWNQTDWDQTEADKWQNVINSQVWSVGDYRFESDTILLSYVVGNVRYYTDVDGNRIKYYEMTAGISINNDKWVDDEQGLNYIRQTGSFYYANANKKDKQPINRSGTVRYDLDDGGLLKSGNKTTPQVQDPDFSKFRFYERLNFNFVDKA